MEISNISLLNAVTKPAFKRWEVGQPGRRGVAAIPKWKESAYWKSKEKVFKGFDHEFFHHPALYVGYNVTNTFYNTIKAG